MKKLYALILLFVLSCGIAWAEMVNINTATMEELSSLNGIGESKAAAIIEYREKIGPFKSVDQITEVKGIGSKILEKIRDDISVGPDS